MVFSECSVLIVRFRPPSHRVGGERLLQLPEVDLERVQLRAALRPGRRQEVLEQLVVTLRFIHSA